MKEYIPASQLLSTCDHFDGDSMTLTPCDDTCVKLIIKSWYPEGFPKLGPPPTPEGTPQVHAIHFSAAELRNLIREMDKGYFDLPGMPPRRHSGFWDPLTSLIIESLLEGNVIRALGVILFLGQPTAVAFLREPEPVLALKPPEGEWMWLHIGVQPEIEIPEEVTGEDSEGALPEQITFHDAPPEGAVILWEAPDTVKEENDDITN